ncbi:MAG: trimeric intracellular cation channel family protein [Porphyromonas sp.]|nr:trimeric intracellular cation channel family protein [Porphyromonas sp.]
MNIIEALGLNDFVTWCDYIGTFAFAISGIRHAASKGFDWFGAYVVGLVTAVGGGTLRDIMIGLPPFWLSQPSYLIVTALALAFTIVFRRQVVRANHSLFFFDSVGLGLFVVVGMAKTLGAGFPWWAAIIMGTVTGSFGGLIRDILINEVPLIFRKDVYATACIFGGLVYAFLMTFTDLSISWVQFVSASSVLVLRFLSVIFSLNIPSFSPQSEDEG